MARGELKWKHKGQLKNVRLFQLLIFTSRASFSKHKNAEKQTKWPTFLQEELFFKPFKSGLNCVAIKERYRQSSI